MPSLRSLSSSKTTPLCGIPDLPPPMERDLHSSRGVVHPTLAPPDHVKEATAKLAPLHREIKKPVSYYPFFFLYSEERNCP